MPLTNTDNPVAEPVKAAPKKSEPVAIREAAKAAALADANTCTDPSVVFLVSKRAHVEAAIADGKGSASDLAAVDSELAALGFTV